MVGSVVRPRGVRFRKDAELLVSLDAIQSSVSEVIAKQAWNVRRVTEAKLPPNFYNYIVLRINSCGRVSSTASGPLTP